MQLALEGEDGPFLAAVLELLADVAAASPGLFAALRSEVASLLAEDDPQLSVAAARVLAAAGGAMRADSPGALPHSCQLSCLPSPLTLPALHPASTSAEKQ